MVNRFDNKDGDQNIAQGENAVGKQVNDHRTTTQTVAGNENITAGRDVRIEHHHHPPTSPESICVLPAEDDIFLHREAELAWLDQHLSPDKVVAVCGPGGMGKSALAARAVRRLPADHHPAEERLRAIALGSATSAG